MHTKPLTGLFKEKKLNNFKIFFGVPIRTHLCYIASSYARNGLCSRNHMYYAIWLNLSELDNIVYILRI
jgi:hypothetical protein